MKSLLLKIKSLDDELSALRYALFPFSFFPASLLYVLLLLFNRGNNQFLKKQLELSHKNLKLSQEDHARQLNHLQVSVNRTISPTRSQMMLMPSPLPSSFVRSSTSPIPSASSSRRLSPNKAAVKQSQPQQQKQSRYFWQEEGEQDDDQPLEISTSPRYTDERTRMNANELMMSSEQTSLNQQQQQQREGSSQR
jgi:hypothetical protein